MLQRLYGPLAFVAIELGVAVLATVTILWLQAIVEEVAWRGYVVIACVPDYIN